MLTFKVGSNCILSFYVFKDYLIFYLNNEQEHTKVFLDFGCQNVSFFIHSKF